MVSSNLTKFKGVNLMKVITCLALLVSLTCSAKPYKLKVDKFNNQKTYIGKVFAKAGTAAGGRMFGGDDGRLWASRIFIGEDFEQKDNQELLEILELEDFDHGFYSIMGKYYTKKLNSIDKEKSLLIKINKDFYKYDLTYFDTHAETSSQYGGWMCQFGYMVPLSILEKIADTKNKVMIRIKGSAKDLTINIKGKKIKKLQEFLKAVKKIN